MRNEIKKINKLIDEITSLLMRRGSKEIDVNIKRYDNNTILTVIDYNTTYTSDEIDELRDILNIQRQCEVEGFYWELMGDDNKENELFLVGSMIDNAQVKKEDSNLYIKISREHLIK